MEYERLELLIEASRSMIAVEEYMNIFPCEVLEEEQLKEMNTRTTEELDLIAAAIKARPVR
jgi:hypothetical protein